MSYNTSARGRIGEMWAGYAPRSRPPYHVKHEGAALRVGRGGGFFQRDSGAAGQKFERLDKADAVVLLNKADNVAVFTTGPTAVALPAGVHVEGGPVVVVEGAQALEGGAGLAQGQVTANDGHDVVGLFDLLDAVVWQGPPVATA